MTGYGRSEFMANDSFYIIEIKSLNARFRDVKINLPFDMKFLEEDIRSAVLAKIKRGRVEVNIQLKNGGISTQYEVILNRPLLQAFLEIFNELSTEFNINVQPGIELLTKIKDIIMIKPKELESEYISDELRKALESALDALECMKIAEGNAIRDDLNYRLGLIGQYMDEIEKRAPILIEEYRRRLEKRIRDFAREIDEVRLLQEVAIFAERCDITEEILRVRSHIDQMKKTFEVEDSTGRSLDLLLQEINREVNTISSKSGDSIISQRVVDSKA